MENPVTVQIFLLGFSHLQQVGELRQRFLAARSDVVFLPLSEKRFFSASSTEQLNAPQFLYFTFILIYSRSKH